MFERVDEARFVEGEHEVLRWWGERGIFAKLLAKNAGGPKWSFLDGPITANNPMGVHHAWGRTYKDAYQRYRAMTGHELRYQNGFDCQGLWVEVEVEKEMGLGTKTAIAEHGIDRFVRACKQRVLNFAARQTEQSVRLGYWMEWDDPQELRKLAAEMGRLAATQRGAPDVAQVRGQESEVGGRRSEVGDQTGRSTLNPQLSTLNSQLATTYVTARGQEVTGTAEEITARLGNPQWGGSYFTFSTENNETIWTFLKKCFERGKVYLGHDVMPWGGLSGSAYSQMEVADGRKLTTHRSCFVRFPIIEESPRVTTRGSDPSEGENVTTKARRHEGLHEYLLVWTTTPWTLTSNVAAAVNPDLEYVRVKAQIRGDEEPAYYYFAKENLNSKRLEREYKEGFGRPEWQWPAQLGKLKTIAQIFKEQGGYEVEGTVMGHELIGRRYRGPFDNLPSQTEVPEEPRRRGLRPGASVFFDWNVLFSDQFNSHWKPLIQESLKVSIANGVATLRHLSEACLRWFNDMTFSSYIPAGYTTWNGTRQLDFSLRRCGIVATEELLETSICQLADEFIPQFTDDLGRPEDYHRVESPVGNDITSADVLVQTAERVFNDVQSLHHAFISQTTALAVSSSAESHRIIDGGRDFKGNPNVVAGEGTGIVHIAPGCGDIDHKIGEVEALPVIAPLKEDGSFDKGFGPFTGRKAIDPETATRVFEELKRKGYLVYVEEYPHIYPHCWRTGEELVFRLVDEWFINMDWREEIKEVTKAITWLPDSIQGQEREVEWLSTMRDWMISKKRFWGLALPIWVQEDDPSKFVVFGSLAELKEWYDTYGGEGWDQFEGHTPHRPWIDAVRVRNKPESESRVQSPESRAGDQQPATSNQQYFGPWMRRIEDVGNPWLDAGITPFSTMNYRAWKESRDQNESSVQSPETRVAGGEDTLDSQLSTLDWKDWYPADFVTECFPGQFRNWFYSLLALSSMMRYDETDDPAQKRPFKCLLGHRLVMDEHGQPMHKSDGTAIWFEEAAEQLGVDTLRWMYLAQNPAADLRFGLRHKDEPVTLDTPDGPISETKEGLPTVKVTSKPADEIRRQVLIPLWNSYAFFVNYAVADEFDPTLPQVPLDDRLQIDRWILSRLQELIDVAHESFQAYDVARFMEAAATYIDDLSNWYIRRNRRRFWRKRIESGELSVESKALASGWELDKLAAYQTLHEVLLTLTKLLAPCIPFLTERMYRNLTGAPSASGGHQSPDGGGSGSANNTRSTNPETDVSGSPESVHLCHYPTVDEAKLDRKLNHDAALVQRLVRLGHRLRESAERRVRQPLAELRFAAADEETAAALEENIELIRDELNVKQVTRVDNLDDLVSYSYKPNLKTLGPKYGKLLGAIRKELPEVDGAVLAPLRNGEPVTLKLGGERVTLQPDDVLVSTEQASDWASGDDGGIQVALSTALTPELIREGMARDFVRHVQQARKDAGLEITDRIRISYYTEDAEAAAAIEEWSAYIMAETLADALTRADSESAEAKQVTIGESRVSIWIERA